jgi:hypothetical protein
MDLTLSRTKLTSCATLGTLSIGDVPFCRSLEDVVRKDPNASTPANEGKVWGATAIPAGSYNVVIAPSPKFQKQMMRLEDVPGFTGILIHAGNSPEDTHGCILLGYAFDAVGNIKGGTSRAAVVELFIRVQEALQKPEQVTITITDDFPEAPL